MADERSTKERLADALKACGAPEQMITRALRGGYDDFESESPTPLIDLVTDCRRAGLEMLANQALNGDFDGSREEAEAWARGPGKETVDQLTNPKK